MRHGAPLLVVVAALSASVAASLSLPARTAISKGASRGGLLDRTRLCQLSHASATPKTLFAVTASDDNFANVWGRLAGARPRKAKSTFSSPFSEISMNKDKAQVQLITLLRVGIPSLFAGFLATVAFPGLSLFLASLMNDAGVFAVLSQDSSQFVQNFLTVSGLLFSILVGQTYYFMYQQQESVYYALFNEVTEAKSLLEQIALVCQGRAMYHQVLSSISQYVESDLKKLQSDPAILLSARPVDDPLESIMYMTSVGVPSSVYETVRSLRQARAGRLGALQRKLPQVHMILLWILGTLELISFPLLGAGTQSIGGYNILTVEGCLFGIMTFGITMTLRVVEELWRPAGGAYNVDGVLKVMVSGLEEELKARMSGSKVYAANRKAPSSPVEGAVSEATVTTVSIPAGPEAPIKQQGGINVKYFWKTMKLVAKWIVEQR